MKLAKQGFLFTSAVIMLAVLISACDTPAPPAPAPPKAVKLNLIDWITPTHWSGPEIAKFLARVKERTAGRLEISLVDARAAGLKWGDTLPGLKDGKFQMVLGAGYYWSGEAKVFGVTWLPGLTEGTAEGILASPVIRDIFQAELDKWDTLVLSISPIDDQHPGANKALTKPGDFKGLRVRATGAENAKVATALGATAVTMPLGEAYMAGQKRLIDGLFSMGIDSWRAFSFYEIFPYIIDFSTGTGDVSLYIGKKQFEALPSELKVILLEETVTLEKRLMTRARETVSEGRKFLVGKGVKLVTPSEELKAEVRRQARLAVDAWAVEGGPSAVEAVKRIRAILYK